MVNLFRLLRERRGLLTIAQIRAMIRLLTDHADALYRLADRVERGDAAPRIPKKQAVAALVTRVAQAGRAGDPVTRSVLAGVTALVETGERDPPTAPQAIRSVAIELVRLAEVVRDARYLPRYQSPPRPRGGRHPNVPLDRLLYYATKRGILDAELASELDRQGVCPDGPGSEKPLRQRWMAILKSARARRSRRAVGTIAKSRGDARRAKGRRDRPQLRSVR